MNLRNRLNRIFHERGLAEGEVAVVARLDQGHLNRIKNGRVRPTLVTALRISYALGTPVNDLFSLDGFESTDTGMSDGSVATNHDPTRRAPAPKRPVESVHRSPSHTRPSRVGRRAASS